MSSPNEIVFKKHKGILSNHYHKYVNGYIEKGTKYDIDYYTGEVKRIY
jgi:hypothetical protein